MLTYRYCLVTFSRHTYISPYYTCSDYHNVQYNLKNFWDSREHLYFLYSIVLYGDVIMPRRGYKCVTIREEIFNQAKEMVKLGKAKSVSELTEKAILSKIRREQDEASESQT